MRELMTFGKFVDHITKHNGVYTRGTVRGVVIDMCECLVEQLLEGKKIQMGELGSFWVSLTSEGAESMEKFSSSNIKAVNIIFTPGTDFENLIGKAEFNLVASRVAQAATLKTEKAGGDTVDLAAAKAAARANSSSTETPGGGDEPVPGGNTGGDEPIPGGNTGDDEPIPGGGS